MTLFQTLNKILSYFHLMHNDEYIFSILRALFSKIFNYITELVNKYDIWNLKYYQNVNER